MIKTICLFLTFIISLLIKIDGEIINISLTSISIIFGFSISYLCSVYNNKKFNKVLKEIKQLESFLFKNKIFLKHMIGGIITIYIIGLLGNFSYSKEYVNITFVLQLYTIVALTTVFLFFEAYNFVKDFIIVYKNSYSTFLEERIKKHKENDNI